MNIDSAAIIFYGMEHSNNDDTSFLQDGIDILWYSSKGDDSVPWRSRVIRLINDPNIQLLGKNISFAYDFICLHRDDVISSEFPLRISMVPLPLDKNEKKDPCYLLTPAEILAAQEVLMPSHSPDTGCILLFQVNYSTSDIEEDVIAACALHFGIDVKKIAPRPSKLHDIVIMPLPPGLGFSPYRCAVLLLSKQKLFDVEKNIYISTTIGDLIEYNMISLVFKKLAQSLKSLPLAKKTVSEYVRYIDIESDSSNYQLRYIPDRENWSEKLLKASNYANRYSKVLSSNLLTAFISNNTWQSIKYNSSLYSYPTFNNFISESETNQHEYTELKDSIEMHNMIVADLVRDIFSAMVASSNKSIQSSIKRLTIIAVIIGIVTVFFSIFSDLTKESIFFEFLSWFYHVVDLVKCKLFDFINYLDKPF